MDNIHKICVDKTSCKWENVETAKETKETSTPTTSNLELNNIHEICVDKTSCK